MSFSRAKILKIIVLSFSVMAIIAGLCVWKVYQIVMRPNTNISDNTESAIYIRSSNYSLNDLFEDLSPYLINPKHFEWTAKKMEFQKAKPGKYIIQNGMSNRQLINMFKAGTQTPVKVTFNNIRGFEQLSSILSKQLEPDSSAFLTCLTDENLIKSYGFTKETFPAMFIPNTYELYWTSSVQSFLDRMHKEYKNYWTSEKIKKAETLNLSPIDVSTLASIVEEETKQNNEKPRVAGVYINRLKINMPLQSDPTVKYAVGDPTIKRILNKHLEIDSPYNTYKNTGLPPGPICFPATSSLNAVLNAESHSYLYFCAKEDFSGYHNFATTLTQHNINARAYHNALNKAGIR